MKLFGLLNLIAGVVAIAGILAGLIVQFQNRQEIRKLNHAVSYYFTIRLSQFSYSEVQQDYASAARKIQSQLEYALNGAANGADSPQHKRQKREIHCCKGASITILGIADDQRGGVAVVSGMSYTANNAPKLHELKAKINSMFGATVEKTIGER
ncbi:unnamed protein product [Anisakis simplex]|uniref:DUF4446 family protein n=1 Tax=Anisakis simplex TaxID=6269 RepID=A0A0M3KAC0_ANISI|nr:unnamed protein product [Anisakis simplex]